VGWKIAFQAVICSALNLEPLLSNRDSRARVSLAAYVLSLDVRVLCVVVEETLSVKSLSSLTIKRYAIYHIAYIKLLSRISL
jgi:hypothetical protein